MCEDLVAPPGLEPGLSAPDQEYCQAALRNGAMRLRFSRNAFDNS